MYTILQVSMSLFSMMILGAILTGIRNQNELRSHKQRPFIRLIYATILVIAFEALAWAVDKRPHPYCILLNYAFNIAYYTSGALAFYLWIVYLHSKIFGDTVWNRTLNAILIIPGLVQVIPTLATAYTGFMFSVDSANVYERGPGFALIAAMYTLYIFYSLCITYLNRRRFSKRAFYTLLLFNVPPTAGGILQAFLYGMPSMWAGVTLMLLFTYMNLQETELGSDYLTGVSNRRDIDSFLNSQIRSASKDGGFSGIFMDIDGFKEINDKYGHSTGDEALRVTADILKRSLRSDDFIARYGGDEFLVIAPKMSSDEALTRTVERIRESFNDFNRLERFPFPLVLSYGWSIYMPESKMTAEQFLRRIDELMYKNKKESGRS